MILQRKKEINYPPALLLTKQPGKDKEEIKRLQKEVIVGEKGAPLARSLLEPTEKGHGQGKDAQHHSVPSALGSGPTPGSKILPGLFPNSSKYSQE